MQKTKTTSFKLISPSGGIERFSTHSENPNLIVVDTGTCCPFPLPIDQARHRWTDLMKRGWMASAPKEVKSYNINCCECGHHAGRTECEVTATSPTVCETCYEELVEDHGSNLPPAGEHGDW